MKSLIIAIEINLFVTGALGIQTILHGGTVTNISLEDWVRWFLINVTLLYPMVVVARIVYIAISNYLYNTGN